MSNEEKQLLLEDLCARLPYGVKATTTSNGWKDVYIVSGCKDDRIYLDCPVYDEGDDEWLIEFVKTYLRPMSSMTEEDLISYAKYEFANDDIYKIVDIRCTGKGFINIYCSLLRDPEHYPVTFQRTKTSPLENWRGIDWLNSHHFDFRCLIEKGLALEAPDGMYNSK